MKKKFTKQYITDLPCAEKRYYVWDSVLNGLACSVTPNGTKSYIVRMRDTHGNQIKKKIGRADQIPLALAREVGGKNNCRCNSRT